MGAVFFIAAGTLAYWQAWIYMGVLLIPMFFAFRWLLKNSPELLERRMKFRERDRTQSRIQALAVPYFLLAFIIPGLDQRFGWSSVPPPITLAADVVVVLGYGLIIRVFMENQYAGRTVRVDQGQHVISTGPYAYVRHPMYLGVMLMYLVSPLALGSYWALLPAAMIIPILVVRAVNEERLLDSELKDYPEYRKAVRYRLLPGIW
jgi:protein-S-isoprenylcysteine O-methyltransferase Ste14